MLKYIFYTRTDRMTNNMSVCAVIFFFIKDGQQQIASVFSSYAVVESGKRSGLCVSRELLLIWGALSFLFTDAMETSGVSHQSDVCICGPAVCDSSESHVTPSSLFTPSTSSPHLHHSYASLCRHFLILQADNITLPHASILHYC